MIPEAHFIDITYQFMKSLKAEPCLMDVNIDILLLNTISVIQLAILSPQYILC